MPNIIQAEFFHVGGNGNLENLAAEVGGRIAYGAPIKTTVRFFDEGGFVTDRAVRHTHAYKRSQELVTLFDKTTGLRRFFIGALCDLTFRNTTNPAQRLACAQEAFEAVAHTSKNIAVELPDRTFRPIRDDEIYDFVTVVSKAKGAWIFVFAPNDLCANSNTVIASVM